MNKIKRFASVGFLMLTTVVSGVPFAALVTPLTAHAAWTLDASYCNRGNSGLPSGYINPAPQQSIGPLIGLNTYMLLNIKVGVELAWDFP
ncbi:MAG: hypothetical protein Q7S28_02210, partial [bacterium]|nr:hypothetical protein [bacterium]